MTDKNPIILPGTVKVLRESVEPSVRKFYIEETEPHTDQALLDYVGYKPYLGGRVDRYGSSVCVVRYTS